MALPSESQPAGLSSDAGQRVNGILFEAATAGQKNTWNSDNSDRVLYGAAVSNYNATFATALANCDTTADKLTAANLSLLKRVALSSSPAIRPFKTEDGYEYYVCFAGLGPFYDLKSNLISTHTTALQNSGKQNPIFQDGDLIWDGVIVRQVPEITGFVNDIWTQFKTAGASATTVVEPVFLCGQQSMAFCWGQMAKPTQRQEDDYGFVTGVGVEMAYGVAKMFKKHPNTGTPLVQWGTATGFFATGT